jgi:hypothetical protein
LSWQAVRTYETSAQYMRTSASGQPLEWRYKDDRWGYHDPDTRDFVAEHLERVNRSVQCLMPTLGETHQWVQVGATWIPLDLSSKPPLAVSLFRAVVKPRLSHDIAVCRQTEGQASMRQEALELQQRNLSLIASLVLNISRSPPPYSGDPVGRIGGLGGGGAVAGFMSLPDKRRWVPTPEDHVTLAASAAAHMCVRSCFYHNGWNAETGKLERVPVDWRRVLEEIELMNVRYALGRSRTLW